jgi:hypothetical protein
MKVVRIAGGFLLLGLGVVMLVTPGPGWLAIAAGVGLLAKDYGWARRSLERLRERKSYVTSAFRRTNFARGPAKAGHHVRS